MTENETLQSEETTTEVESEQTDVNENVDTGSESETEKQLTQEDVNKAVNKQHFKYQEEKRKREAIERELQEKKERLEKLEATKIPDIPPPPDVSDDDFHEKLRAREQAIAAKAQWDYQQDLKVREQKRQEEHAQQEQYKKTQENISSYSKRVAELGLDAAEMHESERILVDYGISSDVGNFLLTYPSGPLMIKYLAKNPVDIGKINEMNPLNAAIHLKSLEPEAIKLKPKSTAAPDPPDILEGRGSFKDDTHPALKGAKFF